MDMDLSKKTTILFSPQLHRRLSRLAAHRGVSLGELVREACEARYGVMGSTAQLDAARALAAMELPVASPAQMKRESQPDPDALLP
jgi:predicted DNA-binding protein